jgi:anti-anti-sigma factor
MSLHILAHPWTVQEVEDGTAVKLTHQDLDARTLAILADELVELAREGDQPNLYLDFGNVRYLTSVVLGKLFALARRLDEVGGRLIVCNPNPVLHEMFRAAHWPGDVRTDYSPAWAARPTS